MAVTVLFLPGPIDLDRGLAAVEELDERRIVELAPIGVLGWGWAAPGEEAPPFPWGSDPELAALKAGAEVPEHLHRRYSEAARLSIARCLENAARLLGGGDAWFESRIATRIQVLGGELVICPEDESALGEDCIACDIVRLPADILPEVGRVMGIHGLAGIELSARVIPSPA